MDPSTAAAGALNLPPPTVGLRFTGDDFSLGFDNAYKQIAGLTLVGQDRCWFLFQLARYASAFAGDFAEIGVYRGGTSLLLKLACPLKTLFSLDTFMGIPNAEKVDGYANGDFGDVDPAIPDMLRTNGIVVIQGMFPQSAGPLIDRTFCFAHFDGDTYRSAIDFLEFFYPRLSSRGVMVFDDYDWHACLGVKQATDEFFHDKPERPIVTAPQQAIVIKH